MAWMYLIIASFGEIFGVICINLYLQKKNWTRLLLIVLTFGLGFVFLSLAMRDIPMGTAYAIWTGLGAAGAVLVGILFFKEPVNWRRLFFLSLIIIGAAGLKLIDSPSAEITPREAEIISAGSECNLAGRHCIHFRIE